LRPIAPVCALLFATGAQAASSDPASRSVAWNATVGNLDLRNDTAELSGNVRVWQGPTSIEAEAAKGTHLNSDDSRWTFSQSVHIRTADADLQSTSASASFLDGQLAQARVEGSPAHFEQRGGEPDRQVRGQAGVIEYDFATGIVRLSDQVWFSNGKDEFRGDVVVYDVRDERVQINPGGQSSGRVRGIIRPRDDAGTSSLAPPPQAPTAGPRAAESGA
jgi:lipopolysaccharide transport protein LptA